MIDLHSHILPGIDDGAPDLAAAVDLASAAVADGTEVIAATPHLREDHPGVHLGELAGRTNALNQALADCHIPLRVVVGAEVDVHWARSASEEELQLATYGQAGNDLLLETPYGPLPPGFEDWVFSRLVGEGYRVMLAHPERNVSFQHDPGRLARMVDRGVLVQVTAASLARGRRSESGVLARWLVDVGAAHIVASDAHAARDFRPPLLSVGANAIASRMDDARARWMANDAPRAVLMGEPLPPMPEAPPPGRLLRLLGRQQRSAR